MTTRLAASALDLNSKKIINLGAPSSNNDASRKVDVDTAYTNAISRANHSGSQLAVTISNFDTQVRTTRLDQMTTPTNPVSMGSQRLTSVATPTSGTDAANKDYVDTSISGVTSGLAFKGVVEVVVTSNVTIANPGTSTFDGQAITNGQTVLLLGQSAGSQNGPYIFNGSAVGMTRAANWDVTGEATVGSFWVVLRGNQGDKFAIMTNDSFVLGTDTLTVQYVGVSPAGIAPFEADLGDNSATFFNCDHNFGTKAVMVTVYRNASPYDEIDVYVSRPTINRVTIEPDDVWTAAQFHTVISKG